MRQRNHELAEQEGIQEFHEIDQSENIDDTLASITKLLEGCERDIEQMYKTFEVLFQISKHSQITGRLAWRFFYSRFLKTLKFLSSSCFFQLKIVIFVEKITKKC